MSSSITRPFTTNSNYTKSDSAKIAAAVGGKAELLPQDNTGQSFINLVPKDTGFTYNNSKSEFVFKNNETSYALYNSDTDLTDGDGVLTGTITGTITQSNGNLIVNNAGLNYIDYAATDNFTATTIGTIRHVIIPKYSGTPSTDQYFHFSGIDSSGNNLIQIFHQSGTGDLRVVILNSIGNGPNNVVISGWNPTADTEYELEFGFDHVAGDNDFFINGNLELNFGTTGVRTASDVVRIGSNYNKTINSPNFEVVESVYFNTKVHSANYTPASYVQDKKIEQKDQGGGTYVTDKIDFLAFAYPGAGSVQSYTSFSTTDVNSPRYILDGNYWNGAAVVASDGSWAQSNSPTDINTNITSFTAVDNPVVSAVTNDGSSQMVIDDITLGYTGQIYPTDNPWIKFNTIFGASELLTFVATVAESGSDAVKFAVEIDGSDYYYSGGVVASSGYAQTNTAAEISANITDFISLRSDVRFKIYLHSDDGSTTPNIDEFTVTYDAALSDVNPTLINVNGFIYLPDSAKDVQTIKVRPYSAGFINEGIFYKYEYKTIATTDAEGYFSGNIAKNPATTYWEIKIGSQSYKITLEDVVGTSVNFVDLNPEVIE